MADPIDNCGDRSSKMGRPLGKARSPPHNEAITDLACVTHVNALGCILPAVVNVILSDARFNEEVRVLGLVDGFPVPSANFPTLHVLHQFCLPIAVHSQLFQEPAETTHELDDSTYKYLLNR
jgi:hypothetical protein